MPYRGGGYDSVSFQLPRETQKPISGGGWFSTSFRYGADKYAYGYSLSISGRFQYA